MARVVKDENLIAVEQLLKSVHYSDLRASELIVEGFAIIGTADKPGVFDARPLQDVVQQRAMRNLCI